MTEPESTKPVVRNEFRSLTNGLSAFSLATLLLILQGSFGDFTSSLVTAALFFAFAIPVCVTASLVSFLLAQRDGVPHWADRSLDWFMSLGWAVAIVGFFFLMGGANSLIVQVFMGATALSITFFIGLVYFLRKSEARQSKGSLQSQEDCSVGEMHQ